MWVHNWLTCSQLTVWRYMFVSLIWYVPTYVVILDDSFPTRVVFQYTQVGVNNSLCCIHIQNINQLTQYIYIVPISRTYTNVITQLKHTWLFNIIIASVPSVLTVGTSIATQICRSSRACWYSRISLGCDGRR